MHIKHIFSLLFITTLITTPALASGGLQDNHCNQVNLQNDRLVSLDGLPARPAKLSVLRSFIKGLCNPGSMFAQPAKPYAYIHHAGRCYPLMPGQSASVPAGSQIFVN